MVNSGISRSLHPAHRIRVLSSRSDIPYTLASVSRAPETVNIGGFGLSLSPSLGTVR